MEISVIMNCCKTQASAMTMCASRSAGPCGSRYIRTTSNHRKYISKEWCEKKTTRWTIVGNGSICKDQCPAQPRCLASAPRPLSTLQKDLSAQIQTDFPTKPAWICVHNWGYWWTRWKIQPPLQSHKGKESKIQHFSFRPPVLFRVIDRRDLYRFPISLYGRFLRTKIAEWIVVLVWVKLILIVFEFCLR